MFPYKIQMQEWLDDVDKDKHAALFSSLCQYMEDYKTIIHHILFTNKAYLQLKVYNSKHSMCAWGTESCRHYHILRNAQCGALFHMLE